MSLCSLVCLFVVWWVFGVSLCSLVGLLVVPLSLLAVLPSLCSFCSGLFVTEQDGGQRSAPSEIQTPPLYANEPVWFKEGHQSVSESICVFSPAASKDY